MNRRRLCRTIAALSLAAAAAITPLAIAHHQSATDTRADSVWGVPPIDTPAVPIVVDIAPRDSVWG
ncbi:hypothetical protein ACFVWR_19040 [Leifsonia sp. NPDC058292]|uniref:hypothetical protein n=1 Tax=Leifsonia sp. NPDC058292 TaxID=3346428 RepID=UPI0036DA4ADE